MGVAARQAAGAWSAIGESAVHALRTKLNDLSTKNIPALIETQVPACSPTNSEKVHRNLFAIGFV